VSLHPSMSPANAQWRPSISGGNAHRHHRGPDHGSGPARYSVPTAGGSPTVQHPLAGQYGTLTGGVILSGSNVYFTSEGTALQPRFTPFRSANRWNPNYLGTSSNK